MSCIVWPGLQPCLEPHRTFGSLLDLQQSSYLHTDYRLHSLSARSLELCTENLGCETGTLVFSSSSCDDDYEDQRERQATKSPCRARSSSRRSTISVSTSDRNFPPPLTTISGKHHIRVRARREGGRLMLCAVCVPASGRFLCAERSGRRLILRFRGDPCIKYNQDEAYDCEREEEGCKEKEQPEVGKDNSSCPSVLNKQVEEEEDDDGELKQVVMDKEQKFQEKKDGTYLSTDRDLNGFEDNGGGEMGFIEKFRRPSRCIETGHGNKGLPFWEPNWVASS